MLTPFRAATRTLIVLVAAWQALIWAFAPPRFILPAPLDVLAVFGHRPHFLLENTLVTLGEIVAGFAAGTVLGIVTALCIAASPRLGRIFWPMVLVLQAFPVFVIAPLLVLWFGF